MKPTMVILDRIKENSRNNKEETFTKLYRYMLREDLYYIAYQNLYANKGASTKGINNDTADGFSQRKIVKIIQSLKDESYYPNPVRREYIRKESSNKKRPLGIPTFTDKLIQEALRMILESVYEPVFSNLSHGFRPNKSCHTALKSIKLEFTGASWFIEGDIKACFDTIDHHVLIGTIGQKVKDARLIKLIWKFLRAGYMEDWKYYSTYSGCPQGGIISPILSNIYLDKLDKFAEKLSREFYRKKERIHTHEHKKVQTAIVRTQRRLEKATGQRKVELLKELKSYKAERKKVPYTSKTDKVMKYVRYADDFIIGVKGTKEDCEYIKRIFSEFISDTLKMELSEEKTLITHSNQYARFLGYDVRVRRNSKLKPSGKRSMRTLNYKVELNVPFQDRIMPFLFDKAIIKQTNDGKIKPAARTGLYGCTNLEIITTYNAELRGICNYYSIASNFTRLQYFAYHMEYSCLKTLAGKHGSTTRKMMNKYRVADLGWGIPYETTKGKKTRFFAKFMDCKEYGFQNDTVINHEIRHSRTRTSLEKRLSAKECELCGNTNIPLEIHHVNKVKNLKGKELWELAMIAKRRKTLAVCLPCHHKIHKP